MTDSSRVSQSSATETRHNLLSHLLRWLRVALVLGMLIGLVVIAKPGRLWQTLVQAQYAWVLAAAPICCAATCFDALKLYHLVRPLGFRGGFVEVLRTNLVVNFVSLFLPGTIGGGAVAWWRLSRADNLRAQMFTAVGLNAVLKLVAVACAGGLALALDAQSVGAYRIWIAPLLAVSMAPLALYLLLLRTPLAAWLRRMHAATIARFLPRKAGDAIRKILESLESYRDAWRQALAALAFGLARLLISVVASIFCLYAVGAPSLGYVRLLWMTCAVELAGMIPLTLSGFGLPQVTGVALLALAGVSTQQAVAAGIVSLAAQLPVYLTGGGLMLAEAVARKRTVRPEASPVMSPGRRPGGRRGRTD